MKILYITTISGTMMFFKELVRDLVKEGHSVDLACNCTEEPVDRYYYEIGCRVFSLNCSRKPYSKGNLQAIKQIRKLAKENDYDIIHCHTPIAAACTRIACIGVRSKRTKVIYTAHGFHFHRSSPLWNWLIYYPIEWLCSFFTDMIITINAEDYEFARKRLHAKMINYVPGVGLDVDRFRNTLIEKGVKREILGIPKDVFLLLSVGELNSNKNHEVIIKAIASLNDKNIHYAIAGKGELREYLIQLATELNLDNQLHLLGFRHDINELNCCADVFCFPSKREGLGIAALEAMASGLPIITSNIHGINDYSINGITGFKCDPCDVEAFADAIQKLEMDTAMRKQISNTNKNRVEKYSSRNINKSMKDIYNML